MTYPASINKLPSVCYVDSDGSIAEAITIPSTPPYTHMLGQSAPANYPSGYQIVPSSTPGVVSVSGGGYGSWAQVTGSPSGGQFAVDTTTSPTGGTVTFSATDAGKSVTINWTASLLPNKQWMQDIWGALHDIASAAGAASGFSMLDANGHAAAAPAAGLRQSLLSASTSGGNLTATTFANFPFMTAPQITTTTGGRIRCRLSIVNLNSGGAPLNVAWQVIINGVTYSLGSAYIASTTANETHGYVIRTPVLSPGTYTAQLQYQLSAAVNVGISTGNLTVELDEVA